MKSTKVHAIATLICAIALLLVTGRSAELQQVSTAGSKHLAVPAVRQEQSQWCWAGCARALFLYYGQDVAQCTIANYNWGRTDCCISPGSSECNNWTYLIPNVQNILQHWNVDSTAIWSSTSFHTVRSEISAERPVWVRWAWTSGGGHFVLIRGYNDDSGDKVSYMDPWYGDHYLADYSWMVSGGGHTWTHSLKGLAYAGAQPTPTATATRTETPTPTSTPVETPTLTPTPHIGHRVFLPVLCKEATSGPTCLIQSPHPYANDYSKTWMVVNPDLAALSSKLHFSLLATEAGVDWVIIRDGTGREVERFSGEYPQGLWTSEVEGRYVQVELSSDHSGTAWGFCVDEIRSGTVATATPTQTVAASATPTRTAIPTVTPTQQPVGPVEIAVATGRGHQLFPAVAYNTRRAEYLVVWQEDLEVADIYAQRVSATGTLPGAPIHVAVAPMSQERPRVAYNSQRDEYLVVWHDGSGWDNPQGPNYIHGRRLSWDGRLIGSVIVVSRATQWQVHPDVAYNRVDDEFLVAWQDGVVNIYGQRVSGDGQLVGGSVAICTAARQQNYPRVVHNDHANQYLVVWDDYRNHRDYDIYGQRVAADGSLYGQDVAICTRAADQLRPEVAFCPVRNEYLVTWPDHTIQLYPDLYGGLLSESGLVGAPFALSTAQWGQLDPGVAFEPVAGEYVVVWAHNEPWDIRGQRLSPAGSVLGSELAICNAPEEQHLPVIAANTVLGGYLVAWEDYRNAYLGYDADIYAYLQ